MCHDFRNPSYRCVYSLLLSKKIYDSNDERKGAANGVGKEI